MVQGVQGDLAGLNPGLAGGEGGITLKVSRYSAVLVPASSFLQQEQLQLPKATSSFRDFYPFISIIDTSGSINF